MIRMQAIGEHVIVDVLEPEEKTEGGLIIPGNAAALPQAYGKVITVGEEVTTVKVDDVIFFHQSGGQVILIREKAYRILKIQEVYGILEDKIQTKEDEEGG